MKEHLSGKRFANNKDIKNAVGGHMLIREYTHRPTGAKVRVFNVKDVYVE